MAKRPSEDDKGGGRFSRRTFLKTAGAGAAATTVVGVGARGEAAQVLGPDAVTLSLKAEEIRKQQDAWLREWAVLMSR